MAEKEAAALQEEVAPLPEPVVGGGGDAGGLVCLRCTFANQPDRMRCEMCETVLTAPQHKRDRHADAGGGGGGGGARQGKRAAVVMDLSYSSGEGERGKDRGKDHEDVLGNIPCPACTYVGNALEASQCVVCATNFFGTSHTLGDNGDTAPTLSLAELRAMAAAASQDAPGGTSTGGNGGAPQVPWSQARLVAEQRAETSDCTLGIVENLMAIAAVPLPAYSRGAKTISTIRLCSPLAHFCQRTSDLLSFWSCGYRNIQMIASSLMTRRPYRDVLFGGTGIVPQVVFIQHWIENAWALGFDQEGALQLGNSLAGKSTWIGACEAVALLRSFRIRALIVQAHPSHKAQQPGGHPTATATGTASQARHKDKEGSEAGEAVLMFALAYFSTPWETLDVAALARRVQETMAARKHGTHVEEGPGAGVGSCGGGTSSFAPNANGYRPPLFFQHAGHSRTIIGVEEITPVAKHSSSSRGGGGGGGGGGAGEPPGSQSNLLIFDPVMEGDKLYSSTREKKGWQGLVKRGVHTLRQEELQLAVILPGGLMDDDEWERSKKLDSLNLLP